MHAMPHAPLPLPSVLFAPPHIHRASLFHAGPHALLPLPVVVSQHARRLFLVQGSHPFLGRPFFFLLRVPTLSLAGRSFFLLASHCVARHARPHARTLASARTDDRRTNDAMCGPQTWLTGKLHEGGVRSARSPLRRAPLLATPIAMPLQCGRPERPGLLAF